MLILIGPSASGKTEVAKRLMSKYQINKVVTYTTREKREKEVDKIDYNFVTKEEFAKLNEENFFVETTYYNSNYYGTAKNDVTDNKCIIVDPNGFKSFLALNDNHVISFFLDCSASEREKRMISRGDNINSVKERLVNDQIAFSDNKLEGITFVIDSENNDVEAITDEIYNLYTNMIK